MIGFSVFVLFWSVFCIGNYFFFQFLCFFFFVSVCLRVDFRFSLLVQPKTRQRGFCMKPVPRHRTDFEFIQSIMDPLTFEKNVVVKYNFFPLTLNLDMPCSLVTAQSLQLS